MAETRVETELVAIVHDRPGVLAKVTGACYRRGLDIAALTVAPTAEAECSRLVARVRGNRSEVARLGLALENLVDVLSVHIP
jgi:acetolactate synthase small subunit